MSQEKVSTRHCASRKLKERLHVERKNMLFVGDALFRGGNDYIMKSTGIKCILVSGPAETKELVTRIIETTPV